MQSLEQFIARFDRYCAERDPKMIRDLNAADDITGWGVGIDDCYMSLAGLDKRIEERSHQVKTCVNRNRQQWSFGNDQAMCLTYLTDSEIELLDGSRKDCLDTRVTWFLERDQDQDQDRWRIRHGHWSAPMESSVNPAPAGHAQERTVINTQSPNRVMGNDLLPITSLLGKRVEGMHTGNPELMLSIYRPEQELLIWGPGQGEVFRRVETLYDKYVAMFEHYDFSEVLYSHIVAFRCDKLCCLSADACVNFHRKGEIVSHRVSPVRATFIFEQLNDTWRARHSHHSVPLTGW